MNAISVKPVTEAAKAYDIAATKHFEEFARLNFPQEQNNE